MVSISSELASALNEQIKYEFESNYLYLAMANWFESLNWHYASKFFKEQAAEELTHAQRIVDFMIDVNAELQYYDLKSTTSKIQ